MIDRCHVVAGDLTDQDWARLEPLLPSMLPVRGGRWRDHRQGIKGILWRIENGAKWDQIPERYGPAKTWYRRVGPGESDGAWAPIEHHLQSGADFTGDLDWRSQVVSSVVRAHQHAAGARKG